MQNNFEIFVAFLHESWLNIFSKEQFDVCILILQFNLTFEEKTRSYSASLYTLISLNSKPITGIMSNKQAG